MYNYGMVQPMSAVAPYNPYGVDQYQVFSMITAQVYVHHHSTFKAKLTNM
jgi:hypothetical protein